MNQAEFVLQRRMRRALDSDDDMLTFDDGSLLVMRPAVTIAYASMADYEQSMEVVQRAELTAALDALEALAKFAHVGERPVSHPCGKAAALLKLYGRPA